VGNAVVDADFSVFALCGGPDGALSKGVVATGSRDPPRRCLSAFSNDCAFLLEVVGKLGAAKDFWLVARSMGRLRLTARSSDRCLLASSRFHSGTVCPTSRFIPKRAAQSGGGQRFQRRSQLPDSVRDRRSIGPRQKSSHPYLCRFSRAREVPIVSWRIGASVATTRVRRDRADSESWG
jgi:hypothetical protein